MTSHGRCIDVPPLKFGFHRFRAQLISLVALASLWTLLGVSVAHAQDFYWDSSTWYDQGLNPSVAMSGSTAVEVHNGQNGSGRMWYHVAQFSPGYSTVNWEQGYWYDSGYNPKIAMSGSTVVEVHNGQAGYGPMWYHVGQVTGSAIKWGASYQYDSGWNPSVALYGTTVVEVHNNQDGFGSMMYKVGQITGSTISWGPALKYDVGYDPSIAMQPCATYQNTNCQGLTIIEVHNGQAAAGSLRYHVGTWTNGSTISWGPSNSYDVGWEPKVAFDAECVGNNPVVLEVHNGLSPTDEMFYHVGTWNGGTTLSLQAAAGYDSGWNPSVAAGGPAAGPGPQAIEVHNGQVGFGPMYYQVGTFACFD